VTTAGATRDASTGLPSRVEHCRALLGIAEAITSCQQPEELFRRLARQLPRVVRFDRLGLVLLEPECEVTKARVFETRSRSLTTLDGTHSGWVIDTQHPLIVPNTAAETRWPRAMAELQQRGIVSFCSLPLTTARRRIGALGLGSSEAVTYTAADVDFLSEVAKLVAIAADSALNFEAAQAAERQLAAERDHLRALLDAQAGRRGPSAGEAVIAQGSPLFADGGAATLEAVERMHILRVLGEANWTLGGPRGAAARLGMKRTTLQSLMRRLGIVRPGAT